jgi:hypothetical protein
MLKPLTICIALVLPASSAMGNSFELSDPATQFFEENVEQSVEETLLREVDPNGLRCTVDTGTGACTCTDKAEGLPVELATGQCEAIVLAVLKSKGVK